MTSNDELRRLLAEATEADWPFMAVILRNEATRLLDDSDEAERLRGPDRDTTGLTYADREAWDDLCGRWRTAEAERDAARAAHDRLLADMRRLMQGSHFCEVADGDDRHDAVSLDELRALVARHTSEGSV